jgi:acyl dehydratase
MNPWYFEDFIPGAVIPTVRRTVTEADVMAFAGVSGDFNVLHTDRVFAAETQFGEPIAHGLLGLSIVSGLMHQTGVINGTIIAFLGLTWRFIGPVKFGDTIAADMRVRTVKETSKPDRGVVTLAFTVTNQRDERVQDGEFTLMMQRRA